MNLCQWMLALQGARLARLANTLASQPFLKVFLLIRNSRDIDIYMSTDEDFFLPGFLSVSQISKCIFKNNLIVVQDKDFSERERREGGEREREIPMGESWVALEVVSHFAPSRVLGLLSSFHP